MTPAAFGANGGGLAAEKSARIVERWKRPKIDPRGRPALLTGDLADQLVAKLNAGLGLAEAARACGVGERTLRAWRRRAWSPRAVDRPFVALEKRIQRALPKGADLRQTSTPWEEVAALLEREHPTRGGALPNLPDVDDLLGELED